MSDSLWDPLRFWPDPVSDAVANADPGSNLFKEFVALAIRTNLDSSDWFFDAADVGGVLEEMEIHVVDLAQRMHVPTIYLYAVAQGWHRLGLRGLALVAEELGVPLARFFLNSDGISRLECRRYHAYRECAPRVTILGGSREL